MRDIILRSGPLEGQRVKLARDARQYSERWDGQRVVYRDTGELDAPTGLPLFAFQEAAVASPWEFAHA